TGAASLIKAKRSFDEISSSTNGPAAVSSDTTTPVVVVTSNNCDDLPVGSGAEDEKMITEEEVVVSTTESPEAAAEEPLTTSDEVTMAECDGQAESVKPDPVVLVTFKVVYAKQPYEVSIDLNATVADLKA